MSSRWSTTAQLAIWCAEGNLEEVKACRRVKGENVFKEVLDAKCIFPDHERPINHAAKHGWMDIVQYLAPYYTEMDPVKECQLAWYLLDAGFHPSEGYPSPGGFTSMFVLAVVAGDFELFRAAVDIAGLDLFDRETQEKIKRETGSFQNAACMDRRGRHLLYLAAHYKRIRFIDFLLNMHVDASWEYEMNSVGLALFWTSRNPEEVYKSESIIPSDDALLSVIPRLQSAGMSLDKVDLMGHLEYKSILLLCLTHHRTYTALWLLENGADVHIVDEHGCNALYYLFAAASARCLPDADVERLVQRLIAKGIDVNCHFWGQTGLGNTTLIEAIRCKFFSAAKLLLQAGADPNQRGERHMHAGFWLFLDPILTVPQVEYDQYARVVDGMTLSMLHALLERQLDVTVRDKRNQTMRDQAQSTESNRNKFRNCIETIRKMESTVGMVDSSQGEAILSDPVAPPGPKVKATNRKSRFLFFSGGQVANEYRFGPGHSSDTSEIRPSSYTSGDVLVSSKETTSPWRRKPREDDDTVASSSPLRFESHSDRQHSRSTKRCTIC